MERSRQLSVSYTHLLIINILSFSYCAFTFSEIERKKTGVFQLPDKMAYVTFNLNVLYRRTAMYVETPGHIKMPGKKSFDRNTSYYLQ